MGSESCSVVSDPMDYTVHGISSPWNIYSFSEYWSGELFPSPLDLPNRGIEPRSPTLQADSLPAEPQGKLNIYVWSFHTHMKSMFSIVATPIYSPTNSVGGSPFSTPSPAFIVYYYYLQFFGIV